MRNDSAVLERAVAVVGSLLLLGGLYLSSRYSYLLFHSLVEGFSILVACGVFVIVWNSRRFWDNSFFLFVGIAYLFVAGLDLVHTLGYPGMGIFRGYQTNLAAQLWISARYIQSLSLLLAPVFLGRKLNERLVLLAYSVVFVLVLASVFRRGIFPICFVEGQGLTLFKKVSEYVICVIFAGAIALLWRNRRHFDRKVLHLTIWSLIVSIISELSFTLYAHAYGLPNLVGHFLKIISFYLIYQAIIRTALAEPYSLLFRGLKRTEEALRKARDELEGRVQERTAELSEANIRLIQEVEERTRAQEKLEHEQRRVFSVLQMLPGYVCLLGPDYLIRFANDKFLRFFGRPGDRPCHAVLKNHDEPCDPCPVMRALQIGQAGEWEWQNPEGRSFHAWSYPFTDVDGIRLALTLGVDITERKRLEEEVLRAGQRERQRVGQDLHDSLGQVLTGVSYLSHALQRKLAERSAQEAEDAEKIGSLIRDSLDLTRSLARGLNPVGLDAGSLMIAMQELASDTESMFGIQCVFQCDRPVFVDDSIVATHLYRIAQEATSNAVRHGRAKKVTIRLGSSEGSVALTVEDDGVGITEDPEGADGMGLRTMRYRAHSIGADLLVGRRPEGGTAVTCRLNRTSSRRDNDERRSRRRAETDRADRR